MIATGRRVTGTAGSRRRALRAVAVVTALSLGFGSMVANGLTADAATRPDSFADLAAKLSPAVVNISTTQKVKAREGGGGQFDFQFPPGSPFEEFFKEFFERNRPQQKQPGPRRRVTSLGSGFVIGADGLVVTNNHVIADADQITVTFNDGNKLEAKILGKDTKTDLALLKVEAKHKLPAVSFGNSDMARVGDWVVAIGNPFGLGGTVTAGIISARSRDINAGPYDDFIQTDASINRGNSGGPLFNLDGEVIGINTAIFSPSGGSVGIGFAIPSALASNVIDQLSKFGRTKRGWLGVRIQTVTDEIAEGLGLSEPRGALVAGVAEKGPAADASIQQGDVILKFDGKDVGEMRTLPRIVAETEIGKPVDVEIWRKGKIARIKVKIGELEESEEQKVAAADAKDPESVREVETLGMKLSQLTPELRKKFNLEEASEGVVVVDVGSDSAAAEKGIRPGDVIVEVAQEEVESPQDVEKKVSAVQKSERKSVLLLIERGGDLRFVAVRLEES